MTVTHSPFDPDLQPVFPDSAELSSQGKSANGRDLFFALIHSSEQAHVLPQAYCYLKADLQAIENSYGKQFSKTYSSDAISKLMATSLSIDINNYASLSHYQPVILTELYYLQAASQTASNQSPLAVDLMAIYLNLMGEASYLPVFSGLLQLSGLKLPSLHSRAFTKQSTIADNVFHFATLQLIFAVHYRTYFPEMLGFALACCKSSLFSCFTANDGINQFIRDRQRLLYQQVPALTAVIQQYMAEFPAQVDAIWWRLQTGFYLYQQQLQDGLQQGQLPTSTTQQAVIALLQRLVPKAVGHHGHIILANKGLDAWFAQTPFDGHAFLAALRQSPYVNRLVPESSLLLKLFEFGGPMFGVLKPSEKNLLKTWLLSVDSSSAIPAERTIISTPSAEDCTTVLDATNYNQCSIRELYYYLVNVDVYPGVLNRARQHVQGVLWRTQYMNSLPFKHYSHDALADYLDKGYQAQINRYEPLKGKPKLPKQAYLWGIEQLAPSILADGCWLQRSKQLTLCANEAIADILFNIYNDEIGNGILAQNHPFIYRQLLDSLAIDMPPINDQAFIRHARFIDSAFDIPSYLMAISLFPNAFLPELLGLNMAIEISGLGKVYLRLAEELKYYGINADIVSLHISIDNVATGHSAQALQAIQRYLDDVLANFGKRAQQNHWRRIYTGYCSLQTVTTVFKYALVVQYWLKHKDKAT